MDITDFSELVMDIADFQFVCEQVFELVCLWDTNNIVYFCLFLYQFKDKIIPYLLQLLQGLPNAQWSDETGYKPHDCKYGNHIMIDRQTDRRMDGQTDRTTYK